MSKSIEELYAALAEAEGTVETLEGELKVLQGADEVDKDAVAAKRDEIKEAKKARTAAKREHKKAETAAKKEAEKAKRIAEREANRMPEQNGVRRPRAGTLCGKVWDLADSMSANLGQPVPVKLLLEESAKHELNPGNVKAEYARWRKFNGVTGRVSLPETKSEPAAAASA